MTDIDQYMLNLFEIIVGVRFLNHSVELGLLSYCKIDNVTTEYVG